MLNLFQMFSVFTYIIQQILVGAAVVAVMLYLRAFYQRRQLFKGDLNIPSVKVSLWNIFWPFGLELEMFFHQLGGGLSSGEALMNRFLQRLREFHGEAVARVFFIFQPIVVVLTAESAEKVLSSNTILTKGLFYEILEPWLGTGLLTSSGAKWRTRRKMLTPAFHFKILEDFLPVIDEQAAVLCDVIEEQQNASKSKNALDIVPLVTNCTLDIICETAMGVNIGAQRNEDNPYVKALYNVGDNVIIRAVNPLLYSPFIFKLTSTGRSFYRNLKVVHDFTSKVVQSRRETIRNERQQGISESTTEILGTKRRKAFLDLLLHEHFINPNFDLEDIREEVDTFMFEGHDTTAMGISWTLYILASRVEAQKKVQQELDTIFADDKSRMMTSADLKEMKYLECCIKEAQRLRPSVPVIFRKLTEDTTINQYRVKAGTVIGVPIIYLHIDPNVFPNPHIYDPDRFTPENSAKRHPYAYVPFSAGPRNCIGQKFAMMEEKMVISHILRRYEITAVDPIEECRMAAELVLRPVGGIKLIFKKRVV